MKPDLGRFSHDLRNPLTAILIGVEALQAGRKRFSADQRECLDVIDQASRRLEALVHNLDAPSPIP